MNIRFVILSSILLASCTTQITKTAVITTQDEKSILHESLIQVLGTSNRNISRLTQILYSYPERGDITITWTINNNISQNQRIANAQVDATNILKVLQRHKTRFVYVILIGTFSMQDPQGTISEQQVIDLGFNKSKLEKVNWQIFEPTEIYNLADVAHIANAWK